MEDVRCILAEGLHPGSGRSEGRVPRVAEAGRGGRRDPCQEKNLGTQITDAPLVIGVGPGLRRAGLPRGH